MLGHGYIKINGEKIPNPKPDGLTENYQVIEQVNQSETGHDLVAVTRSSKLVLNMTFQLSSRWKNKLDVYSKLLSVTCNYKGVDYTGRLRPNGNSLFAYSELTGGTEGLWTCSYTFTEI